MITAGERVISVQRIASLRKFIGGNTIKGGGGMKKIKTLQRHHGGDNFISTPVKGNY